MKVVFFRHSLLNRGGDRMVLAHAAALAGAGHQVTIKTSRLDTLFALDPRLRVEFLLRGGPLVTLCSAALERDPETVYVADIAPLSLLLSLRNGGRVLFFAQGYDEFNCSFLPGRWLIRRLLVLLLKVLRTPVFAVSDHLARYLGEKYRADVCVVPNGIDPVFFTPPRQPGLYRPAREGSRVVLLHTRLDHAKGFDTALAVLHLLVQDAGFPVEVWTVGQNVAPRLDFLAHRHFGYVPSETLAELMSAADVFLHPSRHEGFALAVLESFARRCPVVTTRAVYFARHEENALVADVDGTEQLAAHLKRLLTDPPLRERLAENGARFAADFTLSGCTDQFVRAFEARFGRGPSDHVTGMNGT